MSEVKIYYSKNVIYNMRPQALLIQMVDENDLEVMDEELKLIEENTQHGFIHVSERSETGMMISHHGQHLLFSEIMTLRVMQKKR